jgi:hypothetical protein
MTTIAAIASLLCAAGYFAKGIAALIAALFQKNGRKSSRIL